MITALVPGGVTLKPNETTGVPRMGAMFVHGAGSAGTYCLDRYGRQGQLTRRIVDSGRTAWTGDNGGAASWGNQADMTAMTNGYNALQSRPGVAPGKVALISGSMGALVSLNWAARNPDKVACIVSVIPVINPTDIYVNNRGGYGPQIATAHGGWSEASKGAAWNPATIALTGVYADIPMLLFYGLTDTLCTPTQTEAFATTVGANVTLVPLASGHAEASYSAVDHAQVLAFLDSHA